MIDLAWATTVPLALIGSAGFWGWLTERGKRKIESQAAASAALRVAQTAEASAAAAITAAQAEMVEALTKQSAAFVAQLERDRRGLAHKVTRLERQVRELQGENIQCVSAYAQAVSRMDGLELILRDHGIAVPGRPPPGSFTVIEGATATVFQPDNDPPPVRRARK